MTKAKELATTVLEIHSLASSDVSFNLCELAIKVLSEPEPELKGWIENVDITGARTLLHLPTGNYVKEILEIEWPSENGMKAMYQTFRGVVCFYDSYDSIKQKIKEAS